MPNTSKQNQGPRRGPKEKALPLTITSLQNERIKSIRALNMRKERKATGLYIAEGASVLMTARHYGVAPETLVRLSSNVDTPNVQDFIGWAKAEGSDVLDVSGAVLSKLSHKDNPQSLIGVYRQQWQPLPNAKSMAADRTWVVLEEVRDPGNLGTIIRTCDAVGASGVILVGNCCDAYARECVRATMGSIFALPLVRVSHADFMDWCPSWPGDVIATDLAATMDFRTADYQPPVMLMMGGEGPGLTSDMTALATHRVRIPMAGHLDSLNLSIATALALYQIRGPHLKI
jgi:RNA methyltransferase, TrmH family